MSELLLMVAALYFAQHLLLRLGVNKGKRHANELPERRSFGERTKCSVIVCMRNEEKDVERCLKSLSAIDYPKKLRELQIIDDGSTDDTRARLLAHSKRVTNLRILQSMPTADHLVGKSRALAQALDVATGEVAFITDADCAVPSRWIKQGLAAYQPTTGMAAAVTLLDGPTAWSGCSRSITPILSRSSSAPRIYPFHSVPSATICRSEWQLIARSAA